MIGGERPLLCENLADTDESADLRSSFVRSTSAVRPGETSSINTNRKFTTRFLMNLTRTSYVASKGGLETQCQIFEQ